MPNWEPKNCCQHDQVVFLACVGAFTVVILAVEGIQVHANEGGQTQTRDGIYWVILPAGYLLVARIAAGCFIGALVVVLFSAKNWTLRGLCIEFILFIAIIWLLQEKTTVRILRYVISLLV